MSRTARSTLAAVAATGAVAATLAVAAPTAPAAAAGTNPVAFGLAGNQLIKFNVASPGGAKVVGKVTGLQGESLVGIDFRPANNKLYGVGSEGGLFVIAGQTARATRVQELTVDLEGDNFGVDWNPAADALRIVSDTGQNLRHVPADQETFEDGTLNVPDMDPQVTGVSAAAYTNNDRSEASGTALYVINAESDTIALQVPANAGTITTQGPLTSKAGHADVGFDIHSTALSKGKTLNNAGYAVLRNNGTSKLFKVNLTTGKVNPVGSFRAAVTDLAIKP